MNKPDSFLEEEIETAMTNLNQNIPMTEQDDLFTLMVLEGIRFIFMTKTQTELLVNQVENRLSPYMTNKIV